MKQQESSTTAHTPATVIKNAKCILPSDSWASGPQADDLICVETSVAIRDGRFVAIGNTGDQTAFQNPHEIIDAKGLHLLPGVIDSQVHFREPGLTHKEDLETGTRGAALGGVTAVFEMPNTKPATTTAELFAAKLKLAENRAWTDYSFFIGACPENITDLAELELHPNCCAIKIFMGSSTGSLLIEEESHLQKILEQGHRRIAVHAEDEARLRERRHLVEGKNDPRLHPYWRDEQTALIATERLIRLARKTKRQVHVLHVTTAEEMAFLKNAKDIATVETTPQHLTLAAPDCYDKLGTLAQMNPPIREARHQKALWHAINDGTVTVLGSDHAPHTREEKSKDYPNSPSGMTGVQTLLPVMLDHVNKGRLSLERLVELVSRNPARLYNAIGKGEIRLGGDADLTLVDLNREQTITNSWIASRVGWTPFDGMTVKGWPVGTIIRGHIVMRDGQLNGTPSGRAVQFHTAQL
jgi:dihydroorotase